MDKPIFSILEDAIDYQGHSEICGCDNDEEGHISEWEVHVSIKESDARRLMGLLSDALRRKSRET